MEIGAHFIESELEKRKKRIQNGNAEMLNMYRN